MEETEHLDWGGTRHPVLNKITIGTAGAVVGALAVAFSSGLLTHGAARQPAPRGSTSITVRRVCTRRPEPFGGATTAVKEQRLWRAQP
jgi:hypothetical protein